MINVHPIKAFNDNYIWILHDAAYAIAVDPGISNGVIHFLQTKNLKLAAILVTHHHSDHIGGIDDLKKIFDVPVYGPRSEAIPNVTQQVSEGKEIVINELATSLTVLDIPGHTLEHIAFYMNHPFHAIFCGDTLFASGCGRVFEGSYAQMYASLRKLSQLPDETLIYCAHEYTINNIGFAKHVDPDNDELIEFESLCKELLLERRPTLPTHLALEKKINPFLRCEDPKIIHSAQNHSDQLTNDPVKIFSILRQWKDNF